MRVRTALVFVLLLLPLVLQAQDPIADDKVLEAFVSECKIFIDAVPEFPIPCEDFAQGKSPATLRIYLNWLLAGKAQLVAQGPKIAQELLKSCLANAATEKPDPSGLLFCINLKKQGNDLEKLARGEGALPDYGRLAGDAVDPVPQYPSENSADAEAKRAEVRKQLVYGCIENQTDYVQALCTAVAVHEIFASKPFGDNGELAKAFDTVVKVYAVTEAPKIIIQDQVKDALQRAGFNDQVATAISNPQEGAVEGVKHVVEEIKKIIPEVKLPEIKLFG